MKSGRVEHPRLGRAGGSPGHGIFSEQHFCSKQPEAPVPTAGGQSHGSRKTFLEQPGQISGRQAPSSALPAPRPEGGVVEGPGRPVLGVCSDDSEPSPSLTAHWHARLPLG